MNYSNLRLILLCIVSLSLTPLVSAGEIALNEVRLTTDGNFKRDTFIWADGKHIIYGVQETDILVRLMKLDLKTSNGEVRPLTANGR